MGLRQSEIYGGHTVANEAESRLAGVSARLIGEGRNPQAYERLSKLDGCLPVVMLGVWLFRFLHQGFGGGVDLQGFPSLYRVLGPFWVPCRSLTQAPFQRVASCSLYNL